jgi:hypothetical protein
MAILNIGVGDAANDGKGDSIRDAFIKTNDNFSFLDTLTQDLTTGNLTAEGNISLTATSDSYWSGVFYLNGAELATVNNLFGGGTVGGQTFFLASDDSTNTTSGAVQVVGGLGVAKNAYIGNTYTYSLNATSTVGASAFNSTTATFTGLTRTGELQVTGTASTTGNLTIGTNASADVAVNKVTGNILVGRLNTNAQPDITSVGTLTALATTGNVTAANLTVYGTWGHADISGNIYANNISAVSNLAAGWGRVTGNLYAGNMNTGTATFANATVTDYPSNYHVVPKGYVNSVAVAFAIGLGS